MDEKPAPKLRLPVRFSCTSTSRSLRSGTTVSDRVGVDLFEVAEVFQALLGRLDEHGVEDVAGGDAGFRGG